MSRVEGKGAGRCRGVAISVAADIMALDVLFAWQFTIRHVVRARFHRNSCVNLISVESEVEWLNSLSRDDLTLILHQTHSGDRLRTLEAVTRTEEIEYTRLAYPIKSTSK